MDDNNIVGGVETIRLRESCAEKTFINFSHYTIQCFVVFLWLMNLSIDRVTTIQCVQPDVVKFRDDMFQWHSAKAPTTTSNILLQYVSICPHLKGLFVVLSSSTLFHQHHHHHHHCRVYTVLKGQSWTGAEE